MSNTNRNRSASAKPLNDILSCIRPNDKVIVLIDGANIYHTTKALNLYLDYNKLRQIIAERCNLIRSIYYTPVKEVRGVSGQSSTAFRPMQKLIDWLSYNGYTVVKKATQEWVDATTNESKLKANLDVEIAVGFAKALDANIDHIILLSSDGDFCSLVEYGKDRGARVTVISSLVSNPTIVNDVLRRTADNFIDLADLAPYVRHEHEGRSTFMGADDDEDEAFDNDRAAKVSA